jgi:hypothetical protein
MSTPAPRPAPMPARTATNQNRHERRERSAGSCSSGRLGWCGRRRPATAATTLAGQLRSREVPTPVRSEGADQ